MTPHTDKLPVVVGQVRADPWGGTIRVSGITHGGRWLVKYPDLDDEVTVFGSATIQECYPTVISG